jgi:hypothetical protein
MTLGVPNYLGGLTMQDILCPVAQSGCLRAITLGHTQSIFQALFTFGIAVSVLLRMRKSVEVSLDSLEEKILELASERVEKYPSELSSHVEAVCDAWKPYFNLPVRCTFGAALVCFYGTAIIAGAFLALTLISDDIVLHFNHPTSVAFALAPFITVMLLYGDMLLCKRGIHTALAPQAALRASTLDLRRQTVVYRVGEEAEAMRRKRQSGDGGDGTPPVT